MQDHSDINLTHLTDEQFADLLLGAESASVQAHLKACSQCANEAERVSSAVGDFSTHSQLWAEQKAATHPILSPQRPSTSWFLRPQAWTAAALAIVLATGIGLSVRRDTTLSQQNTASDSTPAAQTAMPTQSAALVSSATLQADNKLLSAIDGELRADDEPASASEYGLNSASNGSPTKPAKRTSNE